MPSQFLQLVQWVEFGRAILEDGLKISFRKEIHRRVCVQVRLEALILVISCWCLTEDSKVMY